MSNREIVSYSSGSRKNAALVYQALSTIQCDLTRINLFHTSRGNEFDNRLIDDILAVFSIQHFLSNIGTPYDNAAAKALFKVFKTEFVRKKSFPDLLGL